LAIAEVTYSRVSPGRFAGSAQFLLGSPLLPLQFGYVRCHLIEASGSELSRSGIAPGPGDPAPGLVAAGSQAKQ
jgi:hypothetical protein